MAACKDKAVNLVPIYAIKTKTRLLSLGFFMPVFRDVPLARVYFTFTSKHEP